MVNNDGFVSGHDAAWQVMYMSTNMEIRMNPAVRVRGNYFIGEWQELNNKQLDHQLRYGCGRAGGLPISEQPVSRHTAVLFSRVLEHALAHR